MILLKELNKLNLLPLRRALLTLGLFLSFLALLSIVFSLAPRLSFKGDLTSTTDNEEGLILLSDLLLVVGGSSFFLLGSLLALLGLIGASYFFYRLFR